VGQEGGAGGPGLWVGLLGIGAKKIFLFCAIRGQIVRAAFHSNLILYGGKVFIPMCVCVYQNEFAISEQGKLGV